MEEMASYDQQVEELFRLARFPNVEGLVGGKVILGCWTKKYTCADYVLQALDLETREWS